MEEIIERLKQLKKEAMLEAEKIVEKIHCQYHSHTGELAHAYGEGYKACVLIKELIKNTDDLENKKEKPFQAKSGDKVCNDCDNYTRCVELQKQMGGQTHNGAKACKYFYPAKAKEPIDRFTSQEQLDTSLKEWQHKLGLDDWIIKAVLVDKCSDEEYGTSGLCTRLPIQKAALIEIKKEYGGAISEKCELGEIHIAKQPHELCLVHELMHCVLGLLENREGTFEAQTTGVIEHQRIETLAKALIMAKYGLTLEWFKIN